MVVTALLRLICFFMSFEIRAKRSSIMSVYELKNLSWYLSCIVVS